MDDCKRTSRKYFLADDTNEPDETDPTTQLCWFQVIKGQWSITQAKFFRDQDTIQAHDGRANLLHSSGRKAVPYASSDRTQQIAQRRVEMACAHVPLIVDIPLEERLQSRTSDLVAWTKTMLPVIRDSISEAWKQRRTGHQRIRTYFFDTAAPERTMNATLTTATSVTTTTDRIDLCPTGIRQRPQQTTQPTPTQPTSTSTGIRWSRHHGIRTYFSATTAAVTTNNYERDTSDHGRSDLFHSQYLPSSTRPSQFKTVSTFTRPSQPISQAQNQLNVVSTDTWRFFRGVAFLLKSDGVGSTNWTLVAGLPVWVELFSQGKEVAARLQITFC
jgi:hypothetical protein